LLSEANALNGDGNAQTVETSANAVTAGVADIHSNGGGWQSVSVMRFFGDKISVRVGDTVEWTNKATPVAHTVTFGIEPFNVCLSPGVT
jgi:plastocyanin